MATRRENNSQGRLHYRQRDFITADKGFSDDMSDWSVSGKQLGPAQHVGPASRCSRDAQLEPPQPPAEAKPSPNNQASDALGKEELREVC